MPIQTACSSCSTKIKVKDELIGKAIKCPKCGERIVVSANEDGATATQAAIGNDSLRTTPDRGSTVAQISPPADGGTVAYVPGQATEPMGTEPERGPATVSVPGYEIEKVLGRGGMGVVYKARDLKLKRTVALKMVLTGGHAGPHELARFCIEAEAVARLQHPNIVQIHEVGEAGGHPYCALEFVEGGNLASNLNGKPMPARHAAKLVEALARAMQLAHSRNVVHRDLKPANILLTADGTPKITDFGLARQLDTDSGETQAGAVMGTPSYMAPEQASGHAHEAGPAADVYALGAILYDCLTGRPPFKGKSIVETLDQVRTLEPTAPSRWQASIPLDLETICLKCLRKEPENRYTSAAELADELVRYLNGEPILARPVGHVERAGKWVKRNPLLASAAAAVLLVLVAAVVVSSGFAVVAYLQAKKADTKAEEAVAAAGREADQKRIAQEKERLANAEADKAKKAREFLVGIFELSDADGQRGTVTARQILEDAEKSIPVKFAGQPELQKELLADVEKVFAKITANSPLAMIFEVSGAVQLHSARDADRRAVPQTLLYAGDRLSLAADGHVRLVILSDWHIEQLRPGTEATIRRKGCEPADAILDRDTSVLMRFVPLPKGTFYMGGGGGRVGKKTEIKEDFEIAAHVVTQGQWQAVMGGNPSHFSRLSTGRVAVKDISEEELKLFPVEMVSWNDAQEFITKLNEKERGQGYVYRLPTEPEWEYACRGGATSEEECSYHFYFAAPTDVPSTEDANFNGDSVLNPPMSDRYRGRTTRVGSYPPNKLGLHDMHGNVWQWCVALALTGKDQSRMFRGGSWVNFGNYAQAGYRLGGTHSTLRANDFGLRLIRVPDGTKPVKVAPKPKQDPPQFEGKPVIVTAAFDAAQAKKFQEAWAKYLKVPVEAENKIGMKLMLIPPASTALPKAYYLGKFEVTQGQWEKVMGYNPSSHGPMDEKLKGVDTSKFPVENVGWYDGVEYCNKLSKREGLKPYYELTVTKRTGETIDEAEVKILGGSGYHIPTDAEWEHGCRARSKTQYHSGNQEADLQEVAWFDKNSEGRMHEVGQKKPNAFGLHDMHGNAFEWNEEMLFNAETKAPERVLRGGHWNFAAGYCASNFRDRAPPAYRSSVIGLRVARAVPSP